MTTDRKTLVLLDSHAIIHRAYHALPDFTSPTGEPTGALYGLCLMLLSLIDQFQPDSIVACYDLPGKTFRHEAYDDYKQGRGEADDALVDQLKRSRDVIASFGIPIYEAPSFEADDILGTLALQTRDLPLQVIIASGDMDTLQLVEGDRVQVFTLRKGVKDTVLYNEEAVVERFGFMPELLTDYKGLRGDPSDNIPGIRGVGEKTAEQLISLYGDLDSIYKKLESDPDGMISDGVKKRTLKLLEEGKEEAYFSKVLATIRRDAPVTYDPSTSLWKERLDSESLVSFLHDLGFRSLVPRVEKLLGVQESPVDSYEPTDSEVSRLGIAVWLLNSELTNPSLQDILQYAGTSSFKDAERTILAELEDKKLGNVYTEIELPLIPIIDRMQQRGIKLDEHHFSELSRELSARLGELEESIFDHAGREFNVRSPKQLGEILFDVLELSPKGIKKTAGGARSTRESELQKLVDEHPIVKDILEYREFHKLLSTYVDPLPKMVDDAGRLHSTLLQAGTSTGRFASINPNMQNIPIRGDLGVRIRNGFVSEEGFSLVACDYSQIELRIAALMAKDEYMIDVFKQGGDIHAAVASKVFSVSIDDVTPDMRRKAKVINFGVLYGMGVNALKQNLGSTRKEAQEFYNNYFEQFSSIQSYMDTTKDFAYEHGYTETLFGRRRYFPALHSHLPYVRSQAERMAVNAPIQGTATADVIKLALRFVDEFIEQEGLRDDVYPLLQIHDEIVFEVRDTVVDDVVPKIVDVMEHVFERSYLDFIPPFLLRVDAGVAKRWGEVK